jgi:hypothetical protein
VESYPYDNEEEMSEDEENELTYHGKSTTIRGAGDLEYDRCSPTEFYIRLM